MNAIRIGYEGLIKKLKAIYGGKEKEGLKPLTAAGKGKARPLTPAAFDAMFGSQRPKKLVITPTGEVKGAP